MMTSKHSFCVCIGRQVCSKHRQFLPKRSVSYSFWKRTDSFYPITWVFFYILLLTLSILLPSNHLPTPWLLLSWYRCATIHASFQVRTNAALSSKWRQPRNRTLYEQLLTRCSNTDSLRVAVSFPPYVFIDKCERVTYTYRFFVYHILIHRSVNVLLL